MTGDRKPFLFVGLDYEEPSQVVSLAQDLSEVDRQDFGFKINLDFIFNSGLGGYSEPLRCITDTQKPLFIDLKMWNGRRTMTSIIDALAHTSSSIQYTNAYALADVPFLKACVGATVNTHVKLLGITVLTHYTDDYCKNNFGMDLHASVRHFADMSYRAGCHGIILPGTALSEVRDLAIDKMVPAVRPDWFGKTGDNYQEQECSVRDAVRGGANLLVCSSPIRKSTDKRDALVRTLDEMYE